MIRPDHPVYADRADQQSPVEQKYTIKLGPDHPAVYTDRADQRSLLCNRSTP